MDHEDVREQLELAAAEPNGIDRLMAGDTPLAGSIAAHLAGCPPCTEELDRLRRASILIGDAVRTTPPPELRERTLALVRAVGRDRTPAVPEAAMSAVPAAVPAAPTGAATHRLAWVAAAAAAVLLAVIATAAVVDRQSDARVAGYEDQLAGLSNVTATTVAISGEDDAQQVRLGGSENRWGRVLYSPGTGELAVIARGLTEPPGDREYRCWVEIDGERQPVGKMFFGGDLAFWAGPVETLESLPADATFGVSLVDASSGADVGEPPVLEGGVGG